ncbi:MAG: hypothetical protein C0423_16955 [Methylibium sp.]|nr:hypothetical protein [Methylibium sp.]
MHLDQQIKLRVRCKAQEFSFGETAQVCCLVQAQVCSDAYRRVSGCNSIKIHGVQALFCQVSQPLPHDGQEATAYNLGCLAVAVSRRLDELAFAGKCAQGWGDDKADEIDAAAAANQAIQRAPFV